jgi:hypothetical protein
VPNAVFSSPLIGSLAKSYSALSNRGQLLSALTVFLPLVDFSQATKFELHKQFNDLLISSYSGESTIKYLLFREFLHKNVTAAFEMRVDSSRVDFLAINGDARSFEIKSGLDNLNKLSKQSLDYSKAFDYNFIVVDKKHLERALNIVPNHYGVWYYNSTKKHVYRQAKLSKSLDAEFQLSLLTQKELKAGFKCFRASKGDILTNFSSEEINSNFKLILKSRYQRKWYFIRDNSERILPIDTQFFFSTNICPELIYQNTNR